MTDGVDSSTGQSSSTSAVAKTVTIQQPGAEVNIELFSII